MAQLFQNFLSGTLDSTLLSGGNGITSSELSDMVVVTGGDTMTLVLDPLGASGDPEVVTVTTHTASSSSATVTRAQEGTTARQHNAGTAWVASSVTKGLIEAFPAANVAAGSFATGDYIFPATGTVDGGLLVGTAFTGYVGLKTANQVLGTEYILLSNGTNSFLSSGTGGATYLRGPDNSTTEEIIIGASNITIDSAQIILDSAADIDCKNDLLINNNALVSGDAGASNIDHIWHDDTTNTWHFCSDTTYKGTGNAKLQGGSLDVSGAVEGSFFQGTSGNASVNRLYRNADQILILQQTEGAGIGGYIDFYDSTGRIGYVGFAGNDDLVVTASDAAGVMIANGGAGVHLRHNGSNKLVTTTTGVTVTGTALAGTLEANSVGVRTNVGSALAPSHSFLSDTDTGMFLAGGGDLRLSVSNSTKLRLTTTGAYMQEVYDNAVSGTANVIVSSSGLLQRDNSTVAGKKNVELLSEHQAGRQLLKDYRHLLPVAFDSIHDADVKLFGFLHEWSPGRLAGRKEDKSVDTRGYVALTVAKVQELEARIEQLEALEHAR